MPPGSSTGPGRCSSAPDRHPAAERGGIESVEQIVPGDDRDAQPRHHRHRQGEQSRERDHAYPERRDRLQHQRLAGVVEVERPQADAPPSAPAQSARVPGRPGSGPARVGGRRWPAPGRSRRRPAIRRPGAQRWVTQRVRNSPAGSCDRPVGSTRMGLKYVRTWSRAMSTMTSPRSRSTEWSRGRAGRACSRERLNSRGADRNGLHTPPRWCRTGRSGLRDPRHENRSRRPPTPVHNAKPGPLTPESGLLALSPGQHLVPGDRQGQMHHLGKRPGRVLATQGVSGRLQRQPSVAPEVDPPMPALVQQGEDAVVQQLVDGLLRGARSGERRQPARLGPDRLMSGNAAPGSLSRCTPPPGAGSAPRS